MNNIKDSKTIVVQIGKIIKHYRKMRGITQNSLGSLVNKTGNQISLYESGKNDMSIATLAKISAILDIDPPLISIKDHQNIRTSRQNNRFR